MAVLALGAIAYHYREDTSVAPGEWLFLVRFYGSEKAHAKFIAHARQLLENEAHVAAHRFAGALYKVEGKDAIRWCDEQFAQGCAHEILGRSIHEYGIAVVPLLQKQCATVFGPHALFCDHGVGHGLLDYYGNDIEGVRASTRFCDDHQANDKLNGCYSGVFMEYFLQNVRYSGVYPRPLADNALYDMCPLQEGVARWLCFYTLPLWWHQIEKHAGTFDEGAILSTLHDRCVALENKIDHDACLHGMGHMVAPMGEYRVEEIQKLCARIPPHTKGYLLCMSDAAYHMLLEKRAPVGLPLCDVFEGGDKLYCAAYATTIVQKDITVPLPR